MNISANIYYDGSAYFTQHLEYKSASKIIYNGGDNMGLKLFVALGHSVLEVQRSHSEWTLHEYQVDHKFLCLAADPIQPGRLYAGTFDDGLWVSDNDGQTWRQAGPGITHHRIPSVTVSPTEQKNGYSVVWTGTEPSGLFRSEDGGQTWTDCPTLLDLPSEPTWSFPPRPYTHHVRYIQPDLHEEARIFVGIELGGVMRSVDLGKTWEDRKPGSQYDCHTLTMHPTTKGRIYEAAGGGYAESLDGGETWQTINDGLDPFTYLVDIAVDPADPQTMIASAAKRARTAYNPETAETVIVRRTKDEPWTVISEGLPQPDGSTVFALLTHETEPGVFYAVNNIGIYRSDDSGQTWGHLPVEWPDHLKKERVRGFVGRYD